MTTIGKEVAGTTTVSDDAEAVATTTASPKAKTKATIKIIDNIAVATNKITMIAMIVGTTGLAAAKMVTVKNNTNPRGATMAVTVTKIGGHKTQRGRQRPRMAVGKAAKIKGPMKKDTLRNQSS